MFLWCNQRLCKHTHKAACYQKLSHAAVLQSATPAREDGARVERAEVQRDGGSALLQRHTLTAGITTTRTRGRGLPLGSRERGFNPDVPARQAEQQEAVRAAEINRHPEWQNQHTSPSFTPLLPHQLFYSGTSPCVLSLSPPPSPSPPQPRLPLSPELLRNGHICITGCFLRF